MLGVATAARAHPVDEVVQTAYLTLAPGAVHLELSIAPGPDVSWSVLSALDADSDRRITRPESRAWATAVLEHSSLRIDGEAAALSLSEVIVPLYSGLDVAGAAIRIQASARMPDAPGRRTLSYANRYRPARSIWTANVFVGPANVGRHTIEGQSRGADGQELTVRYRVERP